MRVEVVTIAYNQPEATKRLIESVVSREHDIRFRLFLHNSERAVVQVCDELAARRDVIYYPYGENRGLSKSWNEGMLDAFWGGADVVLIVNDDVVFKPHSLDIIAETAVRNRDKYVIHAEGKTHRKPHSTTLWFSAFAINPVAIDKLGCFDQNFFPIYCEDSDYVERARRVGLEKAIARGAELEHGGSFSIAGDAALARQNEVTALRNVLYYRQKWGSKPGYGVYEHPFNDPACGLRIAPGERHAPYPGYNRTDQEIVQI
jgi:GT2 family glycosyltransferase